MNPIEILGSILGQKAGGSGGGADILKEIFMGGSRREAAVAIRPRRTSRARTLSNARPASWKICSTWRRTAAPRARRSRRPHQQSQWPSRGRFAATTRRHGRMSRR